MASKNLHVAVDINQKDWTAVFNNVKQIYVAFKTPQQKKPAVQFTMTNASSFTPFKIDAVASNWMFVGFWLKTQNNKNNPACG